VERTHGEAIVNRVENVSMVCIVICTLENVRLAVYLDIIRLSVQTVGPFYPRPNLVFNII